MPLRNKDYYKILQVDPSAEQEVIEAAYKRLARMYHPDINRSPNATLRMQEINAAYEVLRESVKRGQYDRERSSQSSRHNPKYEEERRRGEEAKAAWWHAKKVIRLARESWVQHNAFNRKVPQFLRVVEDADHQYDLEQGKRHVSALVTRLQDLRHEVSADQEKAKTVHLALAAAYALIKTEVLQFHHLNRACDCAARLMGSVRSAEKKVAYRRQRDQLLELLGERRELLVE